MIAYRIADARLPIFDATGAARVGGRWNSIGMPVIYACETYAGALLEILVHANMDKPPRSHRVVKIVVPESVRIETVSPGQVPSWSADDQAASRVFGDTWVREKRAAVLRVPSVVTGGREYNLVLNPQHPEFGQIKAGKPEPVQWDARLLRSRS